MQSQKPCNTASRFFAVNGYYIYLLRRGRSWHLKVSTGVMNNSTGKYLLCMTEHLKAVGPTLVP